MRNSTRSGNRPVQRYSSLVPLMLIGRRLRSFSESATQNVNHGPPSSPKVSAAPPAGQARHPGLDAVLPSNDGQPWRRVVEPRFETSEKFVKPPEPVHGQER